jgi:Uma2 family endonuclease
MSARALPPSLTDEKYLDLENSAEERHELYDGHMYAMAGTSRSHRLIIVNLAGEFRNAFKNRSCEVSATDARVRVSMGGTYFYPDVVVVCDEPKLLGDATDTLLNPILIVEVLSSSTEAWDRGLKFARYRKLESLQEYVLAAQDRPSVEIYRRQPSGEWLLSEVSGLDGTCHFNSVDCSIPMAEIYGKVTFTEPEIPPVTG